MLCCPPPSTPPALQMERSQELHWPKPLAVAAPLVGPLLIGWAGGWLPLGSEAGGEDTLPLPVVGAVVVACVLVSVAITLHYPQDGILRGKLLGEWWGHGWGAQQPVCCWQLHFDSWCLILGGTRLRSVCEPWGGTGHRGCYLG